MSLLSIYRHHASRPANPGEPSLVTSDPELIEAQLSERGLAFQRWSATIDLPQQASQEQILSAYADAVAKVQRQGGYRTVDAIRVTPIHPERETLRKKFLAEHIHSEDEVRFFVEGRGLFSLHVGDEVLQVLCETDDWIAIPAGTKHWFDMGSQPRFCALRFFQNPNGWVAQFTGDAIATGYPTLDDLVKRA